MDQTKLTDWQAQNHAITVVNNDAQRAEWRAIPEILEPVVVGEASDGKVPLTIRTAYAPQGATIVVKDTDASSKQDANNPNLFTMSVPADWVKSEHDLVLKAFNRESIFKFKPAAVNGGTGGGGTGGGGSTGGGNDQ